MARLFADNTSLKFSSTNLAVIDRIVNHGVFTLKECATKWLKLSSIKREKKQKLC